MKIHRKKGSFYTGILLPFFLLGNVVWAENTGSSNQKKVATATINMRADSAVKAMSDYMATLAQFSVFSERMVEAVLKSGQKVQFWNSGNVSLRRPSKLRVDGRGDPMDPTWIVPDEKRKPVGISLYFSDTTLTVFREDTREYASASVPASIDGMINFAWDCLNIEAPAADLLYKDSYKVLMDGVLSGDDLGLAEIDSVQCRHLAFRKADVDWQIWIENGVAPLPRRYVITSKNENGKPNFEIAFKEWRTNVSLPDTLFTFSPPPDAKKTDFQRSKCKEASR